MEGDVNGWLTGIKGGESHSTGGQGHGPHPDHRLDRSLFARLASNPRDQYHWPCLQLVILTSFRLNIVLSDR